MKVIVPLAGPDFVRPDGRVKAELSIDGLPLLRRALESRTWWQAGHVSPQDFAFVLIDDAASRRFSSDCLEHWYPGATTVYLSGFTGGAALSALAGLARFAHLREPVCIDLADILYGCGDITPMFARTEADGIGIVFKSTQPIYSYFRADAAGRVVEVAEKKVISEQASVGTYFFSSPAVYLCGLINNLRAPDRVTNDGLFFVCPVMQGLLDAGLSVRTIEAFDVRDIKVTGQ